MKDNSKINYIREGFEAFEKVVDKEIRYIYKKNNAYKEIILKAKKADFMHLCGMKYKHPQKGGFVSAKHFYTLIKSRNISADFLEEKKDGTTALKLGVLKHLEELLSGNVRIIDGEIVFANGRFDGAIRSSKMIFALALYQERGTTFGPKSLFNLKTSNNSFKNSYEVHKVYLVNKNSESTVFYESAEYKNRKTDTILI